MRGLKLQKCDTESITLGEIMGGYIPHRHKNKPYECPGASSKTPRRKEISFQEGRGM